MEGTKSEREVVGIRFTRALNRIRQTQDIAQATLDAITGEERPAIIETRPEKVLNKDNAPTPPSLAEVLRTWPDHVFEICGMIDDILVKIKETII